MKTAISMPDETFHRVNRTASKLGISRSELLTKAADAYLDDLESADLTEQINRAIDLIADTDDSGALAVEAGKKMMRTVDDEW